MRALILCLLSGLLMSSGHAELYKVDVTGTATGKPYDTSLEGFKLHLVDVGNNESLISGMLTVSKDLGHIQTCSLMVKQPDDTTIAQTFMKMQEFPAGERGFEFFLTRSMIEKSQIIVFLRDGEDGGIARVLLGTFTIQNPKAEK